MKKPIPGWEGIYEVSEDGRVFSLITGKEKKTFMSSNGYKRVTLWHNGKQKKYSVHRLVAMAFLDNPNDYPQVNHIDGNKLNNRLENLEWCSQEMNIRHAYAHGMIHPCTTKVIQFTLDMKPIRVWNSIKEACDEYGLNHANIVTVCGGKTNRKQAGGYIWRYANDI